MPNDDRNVIAHLEHRLVREPDASSSDALAELEMLADLYLQADSHLPALETIDRLLSLQAAGTLSASRRAALESKAVACRLAQGECQAALGQCRELLQREAAIDAPIRGRLQLQCADALFRLGRLEEARDAIGRGLALADECGDLSLSAQAINQMGRTLYRLGDLAGARDHYDHALALYRRLGDEASTAHVRNNLGLVHKNLCEWETAASHLIAALELHRAAGRYAETAPPLLNLGIVYQKSGDWKRALDCYQEAERIFLEVGDQLRRVMTGIGLGNVARLERRFAESETLLLAALERARGLSARREEVLAIEFLGELDSDRGRPEAALARYRDALALAERIAPGGDLVVELERRRAEALCALLRFDEALAALDRARRLARVTHDRLELAVTFRVAAEIATARGRREESAARWKTAVEQLTACRERLELGRAWLGLGRAADDPREARRCFYLAGSLFSELTIPHWLEQSEGDLHRLLGNSAEPLPSRPASLLGRRHRAPSLVACSHAMRRVESMARRAALTELSVLITGATGTGKELIARTIHSLSPRSGRAFLAVNCGALRADLALSQLFGHRKGAFTGAHADGVGLVEAANGGTLFLDEVGELPHDVQVTLLRFLESGEYLRLGETQVRRADVRVIAATNRELREGDGERLFRRDLLFRLNEIGIRLPSLSERAEDIVPLARHFLAFYGGMDGPHLEPDSESVLLSHAWPGNVRELENVMKRMAALHAGTGRIDATELLPFLGSPAPARASSDDERTAILSAMAEAGGNKSRVAERLGVSRKTLYARLKRLHIELE
ncbi:MAG: sigma 54-interacting transcriptional regulator [Candidatus Eisenbacteria bacterium]|nr:sigma 54-interacting transcriptional regulator [Candidatus Eisenbacteria bacterium]